MLYAGAGVAVLTLQESLGVGSLVCAPSSCPSEAWGCLLFACARYGLCRGEPATRRRSCPAIPSGNVPQAFTDRRTWGSMAAILLRGARPFTGARFVFVDRPSFLRSEVANDTPSPFI